MSQFGLYFSCIFLFYILGGYHYLHVTKPGAGYQQANVSEPQAVSININTVRYETLMRIGIISCRRKTWA